MTRTRLALFAAPLIVLGVLYLALGAGANREEAGVARDNEALRPLLVGEMQRLVLHDVTRPAPPLAFQDIDGQPVSLADFRGRWVLLNFWATWCAPCREEMPALDALEAALGGDGFAVIPVATGRNPVPAIEAFYDSVGLEHLPVFRDPDQRLAAEMGVVGLPVTVILDPSGHEIARLVGDADWNSAESRVILIKLMTESDV